MGTDDEKFVVFLLPSPRRVWDDVATVSPIKAGKRPRGRNEGSGAWTWHQTRVSLQPSPPPSHPSASPLQSQGDKNKRRRFAHPPQPQTRPIRPPCQVVNVSDGSIRPGSSQSTLPAARTAAPLSSARTLDFALGNKMGPNPDALCPESSELPSGTITRDGGQDHDAGALELPSHNSHVVPDTSSSCLSALAAKSPPPQSPAQDITSFLLSPGQHHETDLSIASPPPETHPGPALTFPRIPDSKGPEPLGSIHSALHLPSQPFRFHLSPTLLSVAQVVSRVTNLLSVRYRNGAPPALGGIGAEAPGAPAPRFDLLGIVHHVGSIQAVPLPMWKAGPGAQDQTEDLAELVLVDPSGMMLTIELHGTLAEWAGDAEEDVTRPGRSYEKSRTHNEDLPKPCRSEDQSNSHASSTTNSYSHWNKATGDDRTVPRPSEVRDSVGSVPSAGEFTLELLDTAPGPALGPRTRPNHSRRPPREPLTKDKTRPQRLQRGDVVHVGQLTLRPLHPHKHEGRWVWDGIAAVAQPAAALARAARRQPSGSTIELCHRMGGGTFDPALAELDGRYARIMALIQAAERMDFGGV